MFTGRLGLPCSRLGRMMLGSGRGCFDTLNDVIGWIAERRGTSWLAVEKATAWIMRKPIIDQPLTPTVAPVAAPPTFDNTIIQPSEFIAGKRGTAWAAQPRSTTWTVKRKDKDRRQAESKATWFAGNKDSEWKT